MKTIAKPFQTSIDIKKSQFICRLFPAQSEKEAKEIIKEISEEYKDATHNCTAYVVSDGEGFDDDGEPGGTAGRPMLNVLKKNEMENVVAIVTRYFGGIKLGAGGLIRAYTKSLTETIKEANFVELVNASIIELTFNYDKIKNIDNIITTTNSKLLDKSFDNDISYKILVKNDNLDKFSHYNKIKDTITYI